MAQQISGFPLYMHCFTEIVTSMFFNVEYYCHFNVLFQGGGRKGGLGKCQKRKNVLLLFLNYFSNELKINCVTVYFSTRNHFITAITRSEQLFYLTGNVVQWSFGIMVTHGTDSK